MDGILRDFVVETTESLDTVDLELVRFEQEPNNRALIAQIFRLVHTIKGTCGFLGLPRLESLTHAAETVIDRFRDGAPVTRDAVTLILRTIDRIKVIIAALEATQAEPDGHDADLIGALETLATHIVIPATEPPQPIVTSPTPLQDHTIGTLTYQVLERPLRPGEASLDELEEAFRTTTGPEVEFEPEALERAGFDRAELERAGRGRGLGRPGAAFEPVTAAEHPPRSETVSGKPDEPKPDVPDSAAARHSVRVPIETLEHLMTMVSELVLTRNQLLEISRKTDLNSFKVPMQRLSQVTAELQESVMKTRMQEIGVAWAKLPRLIRDLEHETGKELDLETIGAETEIDRQVLELIRDPLVHMVRNAADHGIEPPDERLAAGKSRRGTIRLSAAQEGGYIILDIADDGRGLNFPAIREKIQTKGLATPVELARMSEMQIARFIFHPGFSTAKQVTNISGRGVGMDVVRSNVEQIGGTIDIHNRAGKGTKISIKIPLTLAISAALVIEAGGHRFAMPQASVIELVRANATSEARIEKINGAPVLRLRERLLPLILLADMLGVANTAEQVWSSAFIVVCQVAHHRFGVVVDGVLHTEEIVVKPVSQKLRQLSIYSGTTILGDGSVIMILDPNGLGATVGATTAADSEATIAAQMAAEDDSARTSLLIFKAGDGSLKAVPLALVTRLEEIDVAKIETSNGQRLVQYRGKLMPLLPANSNVALRDSGGQPVLVFSNGNRTTGIVVDEIIDIVDETLEIDVAGSVPGLVGSAIVRGRATDILDIAHYLPAGDHTGGLTADRRPSLVLVDPSEFFRSMLAPVIKAAGFKVATFSSLSKARERLDAQPCDVVVLDIESLGAAAFEFVEATRGIAGRERTMVVGLAARASSGLLSRARNAGFADVVGKFDREGLVASLREIFEPVGDAA